MRVRLDRAVRVAGTDLRPGLYRLVLIEREGGRGEVCFLKGRRRGPANLAAVAPVEILAPASHVAEAPVRYQPDGDFAAISEIRMGEKTLRLKARERSSKNSVA